MDPCGGGGTLEDELVERAMGLYPLEPFVEKGGGGAMDVDGFASHVLGGAAASNGGVELGTTVAGGDADGLTCVGAEGLEDGEAEVTETGDEGWGNGVVDAAGLGGGGTGELGKGEVGGEGHGE